MIQGSRKARDVDDRSRPVNPRIALVVPIAAAQPGPRFVVLIAELGTASSCCSWASGGLPTPDSMSYWLRSSPWPWRRSACGRTSRLLSHPGSCRWARMDGRPLRPRRSIASSAAPGGTGRLISAERIAPLPRPCTRRRSPAIAPFRIHRSLAGDQLRSVGSRPAEIDWSGGQRGFDLEADPRHCSGRHPHLDRRRGRGGDVAG